ncbi:MAG TPA: hypothetical protein VLV86_23415 [Vicinamibacterales bacterium]|nr:hypothetical protein [Vicinamibacterales bacterium]
MRSPIRICRAALALATVAVLGLTARGLAQSDTPRETAVELDVVALGNDERPVTGLTQNDFSVKEDGRAVKVTTFTEVSAAGISGRQDARVVSLLLDDNSVPLNATTIMQNIARLFVSFARPSDVISAVRLTHRDDEAAGGLPLTLETIDAYRAGTLGFFGRTMADTAMQTVARVSRQLEPIEHRRKALICIGRREVCDPFFEVPETSLLWNSWRDAITRTARANASVYVVSPEGVTSRMDLGGGLVDTTGGGVFVRSNDFERSARMIWDESSHYYLLGYTPTSTSRTLHKIDVSVHRRGVHLRARKERGD